MHRLPRKLETDQWFWLPGIVLLIGVISIVLLLVANRINERRLGEVDIIDAIMEAKSLTATAHLWVEEAVTGDESVDVQQIFKDFDKAIGMIEVTLTGGPAEHDWITEPIRNPDLRSRSEEIKSMLQEFKRLSLLRLGNPEISMAGSVADHEYDKLFQEFTDSVGKLEFLMEIA